MVDATTLLFGLPGLRVVNVTQQGDGTRTIDAVTDEDTSEHAQDAESSPPRGSKRHRERGVAHPALDRWCRLDRHLTRHRLHNFFAWCADSNIPELLTLATDSGGVVSGDRRPSCAPGS